MLDKPIQEISEYLSNCSSLEELIIPNGLPSALLQSDTSRPHHITLLALTSLTVKKSRSALVLAFISAPSLEILQLDSANIKFVRSQRFSSAFPLIRRLSLRENEETVIDQITLENLSIGGCCLLEELEIELFNSHITRHILRELTLSSVKDKLTLPLSKNTTMACPLLSRITIQIRNFHQFIYDSRVRRRILLRLLMLLLASRPTLHVVWLSDVPVDIALDYIDILYDAYPDRVVWRQEERVGC